DLILFSSSISLQHRCRKLPQCPEEGFCFKLPARLDKKPRLDDWETEHVGEGPWKKGDVFPDEEVLIFPDRVIYKIVPKLLLVCPAMLVDDHAVGRQQALPTSLPSLIRKIRVFQIERIV